MTREPTTRIRKELRRLHRELGSWGAVARQVDVPGLRWSPTMHNSKIIDLIQAHKEHSPIDRL